MVIFLSMWAEATSNSRFFSDGTYPFVFLSSIHIRCKARDTRIVIKWVGGPYARLAVTNTMKTQNDGENKTTTTTTTTKNQCATQTFATHYSLHADSHLFETLYWLQQWRRRRRRRVSRSYYHFMLWRCGAAVSFRCRCTWLDLIWSV